MFSTLLVLHGASALARNAHLIQVAAGKGLASGPVTIHLQNGTQVDMSSGSTVWHTLLRRFIVVLTWQGILIPSVRDVVGMNFASTKWVLVIEKEAAFRPLAVQQYWRKSSAGHGVIVTVICTVRPSEKVSC